jgi:hypothetical protein
LLDNNTPIPGQSSAPTFEDFAKQRRLLQEFCELHVASVEYFRSGLIYRRDPQDSSSTKLRHITSTATCYESLELCPDRFVRDGKRPFARSSVTFAKRAIGLKDKKWVSDESADIYCRCRGLPFVVSKLEKWDDRIGRHIKTIFAQLKQDPSRLAIGEALGKNKDNWYAPNAFHTFWVLELRRVLDSSKFKERIKRLELPPPEQMFGWAKETLGYQISLHAADSSGLDTDQLGWSLAIYIRDPKTYQSKLAVQDFIRQAFSCLFSTQTRVGTWRHYAPLFHYKKTGNAYCYVFETFAAVLRQALKPQADFVRTVLKGHFSKLIKLWEYAKSTQSPLDGDTKKLGWSSGHRPNKPNPESWATASVFAYAQCLRRLVGLWAREEALATLNYRRTYTSIAEAETKLAERSKTWTSPNLADHLWSMFINHVMDTRSEDVRVQEWLEPDEEPIGRDFLRSAILFGPPGTSKTTLVKAIAGCLRWDYVELHASHFVAGGLTDVQRTADLIFRRLMELDHAVVLFDEIDELVRERDVEPDAFGRFLTTSMLPKLAELWEARKIMYFVATNHIEYFDRAVTRSQRFDAIIFVSPPSFGAKKDEVRRILRETHHLLRKITFAFDKKDIEKTRPVKLCDQIARESNKEKREVLKSKPIDRDHVLYKFALLRHDELGELALHLRESLGGRSIVTKTLLEESLLKLKDGTWRNLGQYARYLSDPAYARRDFTKQSAWELVNRSQIEVLPRNAIKERRDGVHLIVAPLNHSRNLNIPGYIAESAGPGKVRLVKR